MGLQRNGDRTIKKFVEMANPSKVMMEFINYYLNEPGLDEYEQQRGLLQELHSYHPNFWYEPLIAAPLLSSGQPCWLREPSAEELNASLMLALSHGAKGIIFWKMSDGTAQEYNCNDEIVRYKVLLNRETNGFSANPLFYYLMNSFSPRITGVLGATLNKLNYTGNYLNLKYFIPTDSYQPVTYDYLTLGLYPSAQTMNWFAGLLIDSLDSENNYFLLTNLLTNTSKSIYVKATPPVSGYYNYSFRDVEGSFDTSFTTEYIKYLSYTAGEGLLYQVSPVIRYGGDILTNDTVKVNTTLQDNMVLYDTVVINENNLYNMNNVTLNLQTNGFITGKGFITTDSNLTITTNSWSRALLKGKQGNNPKLLWAPHPTIGGVISYKIYRKKQTPGFVLIATVGGSEREFIDTAVTIPTSYQQNETIAEYYITCTYPEGREGGESSASNTISYHRVNGTGIEKGNSGQIKFTYALEQNYPNPFNPSTIISYSIEKPGLVELKIYDILGREVAELVNTMKDEGRHEAVFDGSNLSSGIYFYKLTSGKFTSTKKLLLLK